MLPPSDLLLASLDYASAAVGILGALLGGAIAGTVTLKVAQQAREAAEMAWIKDNRRATYDRFLTSAQTYLIACQTGTAEGLEAAHLDFWGIYGVIQTVAEIRVVEAARLYAYRLLELHEIRVGNVSDWGTDAPECIAALVRRARHTTINAMRADLELTGDASPPKKYNPFLGTKLEHKYAALHLGVRQAADCPDTTP